MSDCDESDAAEIFGEVVSRAVVVDGVVVAPPPLLADPFPPGITPAPGATGATDAPALVVVVVEESPESIVETVVSTDPSVESTAIAVSVRIAPPPS